MLRPQLTKITLVDCIDVLVVKMCDYYCLLALNRRIIRNEEPQKEDLQVLGMGIHARHTVVISTVSDNELAVSKFLPLMFRSRNIYST